MILENVFTHSEVEEATRELRRLANGPDAAGPASTGGRNNPKASVHDAFTLCLTSRVCW